jgi:starvation-inducible DNA-binding protein
MHTATTTKRETSPAHPAGKTNGKTAVRRAFPAPRALATPTDLTPQNVQAVTEAVNPLIADAFALYTKTKNFHWHLSGPHFRDYHLLFDEQAEELLNSIDPLAERLRKIGGTTIRSITHITQLQTIADDNDEFVSEVDMLRRLMEDNRHMAEKQRAAIAVCDESDDTPTGNLLQEILDLTERRTWFLFELLQGRRDSE